MALDYVLSSPGSRFLPTESEKVSYFTEELGIEKDKLPVKIYRSKATESTTKRYFVDKFPIFIPDDTSSSHPVVSFCYIDEGVVATPGFETWLAQYSKLFASLGSFRVIYVATDERHIETAKKLFQRFFDSPNRQRKIGQDIRADDLFRYFRLEKLFRLGRFEELDAKKLDLLRHLRKAFRGERIESLFELWKEKGEQSVVEILTRKRPLFRPGRHILSPRNSIGTTTSLEPE